jgi:hypothetical protein
LIERDRVVGDVDHPIATLDYQVAIEKGGQLSLSSPEKFLLICLLKSSQLLRPQLSDMLALEVNPQRDIEGELACNFLLLQVNPRQLRDIAEEVDRQVESHLVLLLDDIHTSLLLPSHILLPDSLRHDSRFVRLEEMSLSWRLLHDFNYKQPELKKNPRPE